MAARTRTGQALIDDAYDRSDNIGETARHPRATVLRYINQGGAELWDLLIEARGPEYFRATPANEITTTADTTTYTLESTLYMMISVRIEGECCVGGEPLIPFSSQEEPYLRDQGCIDGPPTHYQLHRTPAGANTLELLPEHSAGYTVVVDYVPVYTDIADTTGSLFYGINGWEEYLVDYAARKMATKDEEWALVKAMDDDLAMLRARILKLAPKRDMHRARRVKDVRGARLMPRRF